jgi:hypothetical protein
MNGPQEQYTDDMKNHFGYYATWNPGAPLKLGDIGTIKDNVFTKIADLDSRGITFGTRDDTTKTDLEYSSKGSITTTAKLSGTVAPQGSILTNLDAGIIVEFQNENSTLFKANGTLTPTIKDTIKLGNEVLDLYRNGKWNKSWVIITELVTADSSTILISNSSNGRIELKANANIDAKNFDIADAKFDFSTQFLKGLDTKIIAKEGLTPLFKVMGIKTSIFLPPIFKSHGLSADDLLTPESAKHEHKDQIYFGYISEDVNE